MNQLTPHFSLSEFACKCGCSGHLQPEILNNIKKTAAMLEKLREGCGNKPVSLNCGYRCPKHNKEVGGAAQSMHMEGKAADVTVATLTPLAVQAVAAKTKDVGGIGHYSNFTHVDIGPKRTWIG